MVTVAMGGPYVSHHGSPGGRKPMCKPVSANVLPHVIGTTRGTNPELPATAEGFKHGRAGHGQVWLSFSAQGFLIDPSSAQTLNKFRKILDVAAIVAASSMLGAGVRAAKWGTCSARAPSCVDGIAPS